MTFLKYKVGIDVGLNSVGFAAIEVDENGSPLRFLNSLSVIHESGVDPDKQKTAETRLATSGVARRARRLVRRRRKRLDALDAFITKQGWPVTSNELSADPYYPWRVRKLLVEEKISDPQQLGVAMSVALRHLARHRGWRNPYQSRRSLYAQTPDSPFFIDLRNKAIELTGIDLPENLTPAQVVSEVGLSTQVNLRRKENPKNPNRPNPPLLGKLHQSDNANEIRKICSQQELPATLVKEIIDVVFEAASPKGSAEKRVGKDNLPGQTHLPRALKAIPAFQRFRVVATVANLRVKAENGQKIPLSFEQRKQIVDFLLANKVDPDLSWTDVAAAIGLERHELIGTSLPTEEGERASSRPPVDVTNQRILNSKIKPLISFWQTADLAEREALIYLLSNASGSSEDAAAQATAESFIEELDEDTLTKLETIDIPTGRAAYSKDSLERLTKRMLEAGEDLHTARKNEFGVDDFWRPPADPVGKPLGNPAVDRVLKIVARWLQNAEASWGIPLSVNIETARNGMMSEKTARQLDNDNNRRYAANEKIRLEIREKLGIGGPVRRSDLLKYQALQRQNGQCLYCGGEINFHTTEMDHIVPRAGVGSTNTKANLVAVCQSCNLAKSNIPFRRWASTCGRPGVSVKEASARVRGWICDSSLNSSSFRALKKAVLERLNRLEEDPPYDNRSMESVNWMASEIHQRLEYQYHQRETGTKVNIFRGGLTAAARNISGFEQQINLIGMQGKKSRLDRRHHAMDAAVIALMRQSVATTLVERDNLRTTQQITDGEQTWKTYYGADYSARNLFANWKDNMARIAELFNQLIAQDRIPVTQNLRLQLGNGRAHEDTIYPLNQKRLGDEWTNTEIDCASTPQLWCALTRCPDYNPQKGLPANPQRKIRVKNEFFNADDTVTVFPKLVAALAMRGGYAMIGGTIHHARFYRLENAKKPTFAMLRVFSSDLLKYRDQDLFSVPLQPQSISLRTADPKLRKAIAEGNATYLGWLAVGDELHLNPESSLLQSGLVACLYKDLGVKVKIWRVDGFPEPKVLRIRPAQLSAEIFKDKSDNPEDFTKESHPELHTILREKGWRVSTNTIFQEDLRIVRRDALGRVRRTSGNHLPTCWSNLKSRI